MPIERRREQSQPGGRIAVCLDRARARRIDRAEQTFGEMRWASPSTSTCTTEIQDGPKEQAAGWFIRKRFPIGERPKAIEELRYVEGETHAAALAGDRRRTQVWIVAWEDLIRRTEVGLWIRRGGVAAGEVAAGEALRERIEALEHAVPDEDEVDRDAVAAILEQVLETSRSHRQALRGEPTVPD